MKKHKTKKSDIIDRIISLILFLSLLLTLMSETGIISEAHEIPAESKSSTNEITEGVKNDRSISDVNTNNTTIQSKDVTNASNELFMEGVENSEEIPENLKEEIREKVLNDSTYKKETKKEVKKEKKKKTYKFNKVGYLTADLNVRKKPNTNCKVFKVFNFNKKIHYSNYNDNWVVIKYKKGKDGVAYLCKKYISSKKLNGTSYSVPNNHIKTYMDYRTITSVDSPQYKLQHYYGATDSDTGIRMVNDRYCIAVGSYYTTKIGQYIDVVLKNGVRIPCILADQKANSDTYDNHRICYDGSVCEFVISTGDINKSSRRQGDMSYTNNWNSSVEKIIVYEKYAM